MPAAGLHGNGSMSGTCYKIEARNDSATPKVIDPNGAFPLVLDNSWRTVPIVRGAQQWGVNIPIRRWDADAADHGLVPYVVAEAHRWAFLAALEAGLGGAGGLLCVETRMVAANSTRAITPRRSAFRQFRSVHSSRHLFSRGKVPRGGGAMCALLRRYTFKLYPTRSPASRAARATEDDGRVGAPTRGAGDHSCRQGRRESRLVTGQFELALPQRGGDTLRAAGGTK